MKEQKNFMHQQKVIATSHDANFLEGIYPFEFRGIPGKEQGHP